MDKTLNKTFEFDSRPWSRFVYDLNDHVMATRTENVFYIN